MKIKQKKTKSLKRICLGFCILLGSKNRMLYLWRRFEILCVIFTIIALFLLLKPDSGNIAVAGKPSLEYRLPLLVKLAALRERQIYFKAWINKGINLPEDKIDEIFNYICNLEEIPETLKNKNVEQHEYYTLIKQYGNISEKVRTFCLLTTVAGYQAMPFLNEADGRIVVRIPSLDKWLKYNIKNKKKGDEVEGIQLSDKVKNDIRVISGFKKVWKKEYTRGDINILFYRFTYEIDSFLAKFKIFGSPYYIDAVSNDSLISFKKK